MQQKGYLIIADITGYTAFLTQSELEHAEDILRSLLNALVEHIKPPLVINEFEGDAIFIYALDGNTLQGQALIEAVENLYFVFSRTLENMRLNTTCPCKACDLIPSLDLKIVIHHGAFIFTNIGGHEKLTGPDVILIHRLLKNRIAEITGVKAYAYFTESAAEAMLLGKLAKGMQTHTESYEHLGEVNGFVHNLHAVWEREKEKRRAYVNSEECWFEVHADLPIPPAVTWEYVTEPEKRRRWTKADRLTIHGGTKGRLGPGSVFHCAHGKQVSIQTIVDWRPFDYLTIDMQIPLKGIVRNTVQLRPTDEGTRILWYIGKPAGQNALHTLLLRSIAAFVKMSIEVSMKKGGEIIREMIEEDLTAGKIASADQTKIDQSEGS